MEMLKSSNVDFSGKLISLETY